MRCFMEGEERMVMMVTRLERSPNTPRQENNNNRREGAQDSDQLTLYESIAGSLLRLDKIEVNFRFSWIANFVKASIQYT